MWRFSIAFLAEFQKLLWAPGFLACCLPHVRTYIVSSYSDQFTRNATNQRHTGTPCVSYSLKVLNDLWINNSPHPLFFSALRHCTLTVAPIHSFLSSQHTSVQDISDRRVIGHSCSTAPWKTSWCVFRICHLHLKG